MTAAPLLIDNPGFVSSTEGWKTSAAEPALIAVMQEAADQARVGTVENWDALADMLECAIARIRKTLQTARRQPLTKEQRDKISKDNTVEGYHGDYYLVDGIIADVEEAHGIKEQYGK
jgi:hypothetical protein